MDIGLITTVETNIGDDLIRVGLQRVLETVYARQSCQYRLIDKHRPWRAYPYWHPVRWVGALPLGRVRAGNMASRIFSGLHDGVFQRTPLWIYCGTPIMWDGCFRAEWAELLWTHGLHRVSEEVTILNIASGASFAWEGRDRALQDDRDRAYLSRLFGACRLNTFRDPLAHRVAIDMGFESHLLPCAALLAAGNETVAAAATDGPILCNYMPGAGHHEFGQAIGRVAWRDTMRELIQRLQTRYPVVFLCHNHEEWKWCDDLGIELPKIWPRHAGEYAALVRHARAAVCNRLHASVALAGMGIPSVAVGVDTRMLMVDEIGLPTCYVKEASVDDLESQLEGVVAGAAEQRDRLHELSCRTFERYVALVGDATQVR